MLKKDLGLLILILIVGTVTALLNPRFLSPINISNTANLIGLFGMFSIGIGFVIITAGFEFGQSFPWLEWLTTARPYGVPHSFIAFILIAVVMGVVLHRTVFGRY